MAKSKESNSTRTKKQAEYPVWKYIQLEARDMDKYTRAYVEELFRGILKTKTEWTTTLKPILEGNK